MTGLRPEGFGGGEDQQVVELVLDRRALLGQRQRFEGGAPGPGQREGGPRHGRTLVRVEVGGVLGRRVGRGGEKVRLVGQVPELLQVDPRLLLRLQAVGLARGLGAVALGVADLDGREERRRADQDGRRREAQGPAVPLGPAPGAGGEAFAVGRDGLAGDEPLDLLGQLGRGLVAVRLRVGHRLEADGVEGLGHQRVDRADGLGGLLLGLLDDLGHGLRRPGLAPGEDLVEGRPQQVDVAPLIDLFVQARGDLRGHVAGRAHDGAGVCLGVGYRLPQPCRRARLVGHGRVVLAQDLGDAPVEQDRLAEGAEHHVLGFQVAVEHATGVRVADRLAEREEHLEQLELLDLARATGQLLGRGTPG